MAELVLTTKHITTLTSLPHQVGGHGGRKQSLKRYQNTILKPFQSNGRGEREARFYQLAKPAQLQTFLPRYIDTLRLIHPNGEVTYALQLEDLTRSYLSPCIMDVKLGTITSEPTASAEKQAYEASKFPYQTQMGFRIQGMQVYVPSEHLFMYYDKYDGRRVTPSSLSELLGRFVPMESMEYFVTRLEQLKAFMEMQTYFGFIASSLLFLYEGEGQEKRPQLVLIDFAHVQLDTGKVDEGVLVGIHTLLTELKQLMK